MTYYDGKPTDPFRMFNLFVLAENGDDEANGMLWDAIHDASEHEYRAYRLMVTQHASEVHAVSAPGFFPAVATPPF